jgi:putative NADH-flavin reductase
MNILILGATGRTGQALVQQALEQGHIVTAFARDPSKVRTAHPNLRIVKGDILEYDSVETAVRDQDAVLSALGIRLQAGPFIVIVILCQIIARVAALIGPIGWLVRIGVPVLANLILFRRPTTLSEGTKNIVRAMEKQGVKRFVCESSLGMGDSKRQAGFLLHYVLIPILLRGVFADKKAQEQVIQESKLDWVIVRPAALTNGPRVGVYHSGFNPTDTSIQAKISRADVADFILKQLTSDAFLKKTPGISY